MTLRVGARSDTRLPGICSVARLRLTVSQDRPTAGARLRLRYGSYTVATQQTQTTPQRLAAIREQMSLLTDYL